MISKRQIKKEAQKINKKIGKEALTEIENILNKKTKQLIKRAGNNADIYGRKTIKKEDIK